MSWIPPVLVSLAASVLAYFGLRAAVASASTTPARVRVEGGRLYGPGVTPYRITSSDRLWLGRMLLGETGGRGGQVGAAVVWALAQNYMLVIGAGSARPRFSSLSALVQAYAQPVNPQWADPSSSKCRDHPEACTADRIERRQRYRATSWSAIPAEAREVVDSFIAGTLTNPVPGLTDWHANRWDGARMNVGGNWFGVSPRRRLA